MSVVVDMGIAFDGRCAVCRDWINPGDHFRVLDEIPEGASHGYVHANAEGIDLPCQQDGLEPAR